MYAHLQAAVARVMAVLDKQSNLDRKKENKIFPNIVWKEAGTLHSARSCMLPLLHRL